MTAPAIIHLLGKVTQVIDPENFFMQIGTDEDLAKFCQFEMDLEEFCIGKDVKDYTDPDKLSVGSLALVLTSDNGGGWRRGQITRLDLDKRSADVYCVDYGTTVLVDIDHLFLDFQDFISQYPQQALKCCLVGIRPISKSWPSRAIKTFQTLTDGEVFHTVIHYNYGGTFSVSLFTQDDGLSLAHKMLQDELGVPSDDATFATFDEVKENFVQNQCNEGEYYNVTEDDYSGENASGWDNEGIHVNEEQNFNHNNDSVDVFLSGNTDSRAGSCSGTSENVNFQDPRSDDVYTSPDYSGSTHTSSNEAEAFNEETLNKNPESSPDKIIPKFDFGPLQNTKNTSAVKIKEKLRKDTVTKLHKENIKIKEEMVEQANMAVLAGYGGLDDLDHQYDGGHKDPSYIKTDTDTVDTDSTETSEYDSVKSASLNQLTDRKENDLKTRNRHGSGNSDVVKSKSISDVRKNSPRNSPTRFRQSPRYFKGSRNSPVTFSSDDSEQRKQSTTTDQQKCSSTTTDQKKRSSTPETENLQRTRTEFSKQRYKIPLVTEIKSDVMQYDIYTALTKIFQESDTDEENVTRDKLQKLFSTDMYMFLDKEQISEIITLVLNRAIRYYGEIHDAMLEIIETLENTEDFVECLMHGLKKMLDAYIKAHTTRSLYHTQCSKILAHICNMSIHWGERASAIQEYVISVIEKWIFFNTKGTQTGKSVDKLQLIYLDCFVIIWQIVGTALVKLNPELQSKLVEACKDKLFCPEISRKVKEKLLEVYVSCFCSQQNQEEKETVDRDCQTDPKWCFTVDMGCQTDVSTTLTEYPTDTPQASVVDTEDFPSWSHVVKKSVPQENKTKTYDEHRLKTVIKANKPKSKSNMTEVKTSYSEITAKTHQDKYTLKTSPNQQTVRTSPNSVKDKYLKRNTLKESFHPPKSYSASRSLLHEKPKTNKSKTSPTKGDNLAPTKGNSKLSLTGIMKDMEAKYNKESRSDTDVSSNQDATPDHWDDSFSDQDGCVDMKNKDSIAKDINKEKTKSGGGQYLNVEKKDETIDWWSLGDQNNEKKGTISAKDIPVTNPADCVTSNVEENNLGSLAESGNDTSMTPDKKIDQNENVIKSNYATKNNIYIDDDDNYDPYKEFDDLDYATFSNDEEDEDFGDSRVAYKQNQTETKNPSYTEDSNTTTKPKTSYSEPKAPSWRPGQRKCTICGETTHLTYNCPAGCMKNPNCEVV